jgi:hypothetical protein
VTVAEAFVGGKAASTENPDVYQVIVHVGTEVVTGPTGEDAGVSAETPPVPRPVPGHPADAARCHVEDGPAISVSTAQMIACEAALSWMRHGADGQVLDLGRRRRRPNAALRRAARERDGCRCRFPGCESRRVDLHHIQHWANGGRTRLTNLISLCRYHHTLVHERGYLIITRPDGTFGFGRPDGTPVECSPPVPPLEGKIGDFHDAGITPETIVPSWYGERLDLDHAIYVCLANAENKAREAQRPPAQPAQSQDQDQPGAYEPFQPTRWVSELSDWIDYIGRYYRDHPAA